MEWRRGPIHSIRKFETVLETVKNHAPMTLRFNLKDPLLLYTSIMISNRAGLQLLRLFNKKDGACFMNHPLQSKEVELFGDKKWFHIHIDWNLWSFFKYLCPNYFSSKLVVTFPLICNDAMPMNGSVQNFQAEDFQPDVSTILAVNPRMCITSTINFYHFSRIFLINSVQKMFARHSS